MRQEPEPGAQRSLWKVRCGHLDNLLPSDPQSLNLSKYEGLEAADSSFKCAGCSNTTTSLNAFLYISREELHIQ